MAAINIMTMNVTSLIARERRLEADQFIKEEKVDIIMMQEAHLNERHRLKLSNMNVYRNDEGVGTVVCILDRYKSECVRINNMKTVVVAAAKINKQIKSIVVMSIYVPCTAKRADLVEDLKVIGEICEEYDKCIIGGDWNARNIKWNSENDGITNGNGRILEEWLEENEEITMKSTKENTFRNETKLDYFVTSKCMDEEVTLERKITGK